LTLGSFAAGVGPAHATSNVTANRISGVNRYATAVQIAEAKFPTGAQNAILVSGQNFPDALSAGFLAGLNSAPILLTDPATLSPETSAALGTLHTRTVWIVGGTDAVAPGIATAVAAMTSTSPQGGLITVNRIAGQSRYDTMQMVDQTAAPNQVGILDGKAVAIVAQGLDFADALSASALSYKDHLPIVLTDPSTLVSQASQVLSALNIKEVIIAGGTSAVSAAVEQSINNMGIATMFRAAGTDRTDTAAKLASWEVANADFTNNEVVLARGDAFPDALAGGVYAGDPKPILLSLDTNNLGGFTSNYLLGNSASINIITVLGGFQALSDTLVAAAQAAAENNGNGGGAGAGGSIGGGGGNGGFGNVSPAANPEIAAPVLIGAGPLPDGFMQFRFDKTVTTIVNQAGFGVFGPDTSTAGGVTAGPGAPCIIDPNGVAVDCQLPTGISFTLADVDGGSVTGPGGLPNVLNIATIQGGNVPTPPQLLLIKAAVTSPEFNSITYTFSGTVTALGATGISGFGFSTTDGNTTFFGNTATAVISGNTVTVSYPPQDGVANAAYFFVRDATVLGGAESGVGTLPSQRPNLLSITRVLNSPQQFVYTVDKASALAGGAPGDFILYRNAQVPATNLLAYRATAVSQISGTQWLATFAGAPAGASILNTNNTASVVWGAIDWTAVPAAHAALTTVGAPLAANSDSAVAIAAASTALANGPVLQSFQANVGSGQGVFSFDRPIAAGVVAADFFLVLNNGTVVAGTGVVAVSNNQVTIQFPAAGGGFQTANSVGGGLIGPFGIQPGINGGALGTAATDSAGNAAVGTSVAGSLVP
jgi:putative cell wall-binding protein